ncbi:MAG: Maf family nucleotide pyrophosphatase [Parvibaculum sp.]|nr:Maf family nucleotide pyrophosphatase [Parvibaculum sp.]|tara:strand:+ start:4291 stop:4893 length:603 start_codon:yes stop_codon:yes gene_type:complete
MVLSHSPLLLASGSLVRANLLRGAGVTFEIQNSRVDEDAIKERFADSDIDALAILLAEAKALAVSKENPAALVIGADQILSCNGERFDKPHDMTEARSNLQKFRGTSHRLHSGIVLAQDGRIVWRHSDHADLTMRPFSDLFLDDYLALVDDKVLTSVGCYQLEGAGIQLFEKITGDYFTILGLPLLPLLAELRARGVVGT